ncbi:MAG: N-acetylmuramic acid 6-phosphate etherase [Alphaproteobacteria bacterium]
METENRAQFTHGLSSLESIEVMAQFQQKALDANIRSLPQIAQAADAAAARLLKSQGRMIYVGAGTSVRVGVQDGSELMPTFNWPAHRLAFLIAGGQKALLQAVENAEDDAAQGIIDMQALKPTPNDVIIAVAASGNTPFTLAALEEAKTQRALTIGVYSNPDSQLEKKADIPILLRTGAEFISGSTRLSAGTAQKICLNMLSTQIMINLGRTYEGLMVYVQASNRKLVERSQKMAVEISGKPLSDVQTIWQQTHGRLPLTLLMLTGLSLNDAQTLLNAHYGHFPNAYTEALTIIKNELSPSKER